MRSNRNVSRSHRSTSERLKKKLSAKSGGNNFINQNPLDDISSTDIQLNDVVTKTGGSSALDQFHNLSVPCCSKGRFAVCDIFFDFIEKERRKVSKSDDGCCHEVQSSLSSPQSCPQQSLLGKIMFEYMLQERAKELQQTHKSVSTKKKKRKRKKKKTSSCNDGIEFSTEGKTEDNRKGQNSCADSDITKSTPVNEVSSSELIMPQGENLSSREINLNKILDQNLKDDLNYSGKSQAGRIKYPNRSLLSFMQYLQNKYEKYVKDKENTRIKGSQETSNNIQNINKKKTTSKQQRSNERFDRSNSNSSSNTSVSGKDILPSICLKDILKDITSIQCPSCRIDVFKQFQLLLTSSASKCDPEINLGSFDQQTVNLSSADGWTLDSSSVFPVETQSNSHLTIPTVGNQLHISTCFKDAPYERDIESGSLVSKAYEEDPSKTYKWQMVWKQGHDECTSQFLQLRESTYQNEKNVNVSTGSNSLYPLSLKVLFGIVEDILVPCNLVELNQFEENEASTSNKKENPSCFKLVASVEMDNEKMRKVHSTANDLLKEVTSDIKNMRDLLNYISNSLNCASKPITHKCSTTTDTSLSLTSGFNTKASATLQKSDKNLLGYMQSFQDILSKLTSMTSTACLLRLSECKWLNTHIIEKLWTLYEDTLLLFIEPILEHHEKVIQLASSQGMVPILYLDESLRSSFLNMQLKKLEIMERMQDKLEEILYCNHGNTIYGRHSQLLFLLILASYFDQKVEQLSDHGNDREKKDLNKFQFEHICGNMLQERLSVLCDTIHRRKINDIFALQTKRCNLLRTKSFEAVDQINQQRQLHFPVLSNGFEFLWNAIVIQYEELYELDKSYLEDSCDHTSTSELRRRQSSTNGKTEFSIVSKPDIVPSPYSSIRTRPSPEETKQLCQMAGVIAAKYRILCQIHRHDWLSKHCPIIFDQDVFNDSHFSLIIKEIINLYDDDLCSHENHTSPSDVESSALKSDHKIEQKQTQTCVGGGKRRLSSIISSLVLLWLQDRCMEWNADITQSELLNCTDEDFLDEKVDQNHKMATGNDLKNKKKNTKNKKKSCKKNQIQVHESIVHDDDPPLHQNDSTKTSNFCKTKSIFSEISTNELNKKDVVNQNNEKAVEVPNKKEMYPDFTKDENNSNCIITTHYQENEIEIDEEIELMSVLLEDGFQMNDESRIITSHYECKVGVRDQNSFEPVKSYLMRRLDAIEELERVQKSDRRSSDIIRL